METAPKRPLVLGGHADKRLYTRPRDGLGDDSGHFAG